MADQAEKLAMFKAVSGTDDDGFAISFLEAHDWNVETAVNSLMGGGAAAAGGSSAMEGAAAPESDEAMAARLGMPDESTDPLLDRAPMSQYKDTLMDPAQRMPPTPAAQVTHRLEAFRDAKTDAVEARGEDAKHDPRRPKTLADIYRRPAEICFNGSFDELRQAGREQGRWLLVNIQSPTEFASQQLNADTWSDEMLRIIVSASFLFWQQYMDDDLGSKYVRHYNVTALPHIALIDPVTGQLVKSWTGFKDAERLMDKLTEMADTPPTDGYAAEAMVEETTPRPAGGGGGGGGGGGDDEFLKQAIAASLGNANYGVGPTDSAPEAEPEAPWPAAPPEPEAGVPDVMTLRVRLPDGAQHTQRFLPQHTLRDLLCSVHHAGVCVLSSRKVYQLASTGFTPVTDPETTLGSIGLSGRVMVNISERS